VQSRSMPPMRKGHVEWLRRARGRGHGQRPRTPALHLPLTRSRLRAQHPKFVGAVAAALASVLLLSLAGPSVAAPSYASDSPVSETTTTTSLAPSTTPQDPALRTPRLMAAGDATGTPYATALISVRGRSYGICTAGVWKPTVLMTAAHCVVDERDRPIDPSTFSVVTPGSPFRVTSAGVEGATPARVVRSFVVDRIPAPRALPYRRTTSPSWSWINRWPTSLLPTGDDDRTRALVHRRHPGLRARLRLPLSG